MIPTTKVLRRLSARQAQLKRWNLFPIEIPAADAHIGGFGFVEMATDEEAAKAIEMWNGKNLMVEP